jgi:hypothetical protein
MFRSAVVWRNQTRKFHRLRVFLDLDDCLINAGMVNPGQYQDAKKSWKDLGIDCSCIAFPSSLRVDYYYVAFRPGLFSFLEEASELADLYVFTAGTFDYATEVVKLIDPERKMIRKYWGREMVTWNGRVMALNPLNRPYTKDLTRLGVDFQPLRSVLIDNQITNMIFQPQNGILSESSTLMQLGFKYLQLCEHNKMDPVTFAGANNLILRPEHNPLDSVLSDLNRMKDLDDVRPYLHEKHRILHKLKSLSKEDLPWDWHETIQSHDSNALI